MVLAAFKFGSAAGVGNDRSWPLSGLISVPDPVSQPTRVGQASLSWALVCQGSQAELVLSGPGKLKRQVRVSAGTPACGRDPPAPPTIPVLQSGALTL